MNRYLGYVARILWEGQHPIAKTNRELQTLAENARKFVATLKSFTGFDLTVDYVDGGPVPILNGRLFDPSEQSEGQRILLAWAIAFHNQGGQFANSYVFLDEPEAHLHPELSRQLIEILKVVIGGAGQLWIATHSVSLVASLGIDSLFLAKDNAIQSVYGRHDHAIDALIGGREGREKLALALRDADDVANSNFLLECIADPGVAGHVHGDTQEKQFLATIQMPRVEGTPLVVIDFGAGKGRFASALASRANDGETDLLKSVEYHAFVDQRFASKTELKECQAAVTQLQVHSPKSQVWIDMHRLIGTYKGKAGIVVLANVLHEIDPVEWLKVLGDVRTLLDNEGKLVVMEDLVPGVGELPNSIGYIILDEFCLATLCGQKEPARVLHCKDDRVIVMAIAAKDIAPTSASRVSALKQVADKALREVSAVRALPTRDHKAGRRHAMYAMQYANATLALKQLSETTD